MDTITHKVRTANWKAIVAQCQSRPKGQTIAAWCEENNIKLNTYYYWQRRVRQDVYQEMKTALPMVPGNREMTVSFAEIPVHPVRDTYTEAEDLFSSFCPDAVIRKGDTLIGVTNNVSSHILDRIMENINHVG